MLVARGAAAPALQAEAPVGPGRPRPPHAPAGLAVAGVTDALGGGPLLVRNGKPVFNAGEAFSDASSRSAQPRTAVGQLADGSIVLVAVDGGLPGYSRA